MHTCETVIKPDKTFFKIRSQAQYFLKILRIFQPPRVIDSELRVPDDKKVSPATSVVFVKFRYPHHASPSGYDRICDYIKGETIRVSPRFYWLGETVLRPYCLWQSKTSGKYEYSRYDCIQEIQFLYESLRTRTKSHCHFIYAEKCFHLTSRYAEQLRQRGHRLIGTVHHMPYQMSDLFTSLDHFRNFDLLLTMDRSSIAFWSGVTGKENVQHVPHGVDCDFFTPPVEHARFKQPVVLFAGSHERDISSLENVIQKTHSPAPTFILIGKSKELARIAERHRSVKHLAYVDDLSYADLLRTSSVLLLPLLGSTVCNVVLEAQASGLPVVTTRGGIESYLKPESSHVVDSGDVDGLVKGVERFLASDEDVRKSARINAERFSWQNVAKMHVEILAKCT